MDVKTTIIGFIFMLKVFDSLWEHKSLLTDVPVFNVQVFGFDYPLTKKGV